jgi:SAM-dependent methyltransferase
MFHNRLIKYLYHSPLSLVFPTSVRRLKAELKDCATVLDLGCGPSSPLQYVENLDRSVGVEAYKAYVEQSKKNKIHDEYIEENINTLDFKAGEFDAIILIGVLEHIERDEGLKLIEKCKKWASKKIIVTTPNGFIEQKSLDGNPLQVHLSGWLVKELAALGFRIRGLCGLKWLRQEVDAEGMGDDLLVTMRFRPRLFWFVISTITVPLTYFFPRTAFDLFCVWRKH